MLAFRCYRFPVREDAGHGGKVENVNFLTWADHFGDFGKNNNKPAAIRDECEEEKQQSVQFRVSRTFFVRSVP